MAVSNGGAPAGLNAARSHSQFEALSVVPPSQVFGVSTAGFSGDEAPDPQAWLAAIIE